MQLRTEINIDRAPFSISHGDGILQLGSCFSTHMADRLRRSLFEVSQNPFGTSYNPSSLAQQLKRILSGQLYELVDLEYFRELYFSFDHYTAFSHSDQHITLSQINTALSEAHHAIANTKLILLTLGTAHAWMYEEKGRIVNNCHRLPGQKFARVLLSPAEINQELHNSLTEILNAFPMLNVVISVSPVRHLRDGAIANQLSKSHLITAAHELALSNDRITYFPAYEIMMDDLRDYRFYANDMLHPSELAVDYIWHKFSSSILSQASLEALPRIDKITRFLAHSPKNAASESYQTSVCRMLELLQSEKEKLPFAHWDEIEKALNKIRAHA